MHTFQTRSKINTEKKKEKRNSLIIYVFFLIDESKKHFNTFINIFFCLVFFLLRNYILKHFLTNNVDFQRVVKMSVNNDISSFNHKIWCHSLLEKMLIICIFTCIGKKNMIDLLTFINHNILFYFAGFFNTLISTWAFGSFDLSRYI